MSLLPLVILILLIIDIEESKKNGDNLKQKRLALSFFKA